MERRSTPGSVTPNAFQQGANPQELARLLVAADGAQREAAWEAFVDAHTRILLHTCRKVARDRDGALDGYAHVLETLRADDCRRLRAYRPRSGTRFTTWLVVVTQRILLDHYRHRYGRPRTDDESRLAAQATRRHLEDLVGAEVDPDHLAATGDAEAAVRREQLTHALREALDELAPSDRLLLALRFQDERSVREIASLLRMPTVFHVYRRIGVVLGLLRRSLALRGVEGSEP